MPRGINDADTGLPLEPKLDKTGFSILKCGVDEPDPCNGQDPGFGAFVAVIRPAYVGNYHVELQYCDPRTHVSGEGCNEDPSAWNHSGMVPPEAPNPCRPLPAGKGGARLGLACTLQGTSFQVKLYLSWNSIYIYSCGELPKLFFDCFADSSDPGQGCHGTEHC